MKLGVVFSLLLATAGFAAENLPPLEALTRTVAQSSDPKLQLNVLRGMNAALKGKRNLAAPRGWLELYAKLSASSNRELRQQAQMLSVVFGGEEALTELRQALADPKVALTTRKAALDSLVSARDQPSIALLLKLLNEPGPLRQPALRGLANFDQPEIPKALLTAYANLGSDEKRDALAALAMRPASARALLGEVDAKRINRADLSAPLARQLQDLKNGEVDEWLRRNWGAVRTSSTEKQAEIARYKKALTPAVIEKGDPSHGRALFAQTCAACHTLFGNGGKIGPELPGAFEDVDYLLQNIIDPNALIGKDYQQTVVQTKSGQTLVGIVGADDGSSLALKTLAGPVTLQRAEIAQVSLLEVSLMPEGLLATMKPDDVRDLFAYLRLHGPVPMLASAANVNDFFNGTDLTNWSVSDKGKASVKDGVITLSGSADRAEFITSELAAENFKLTAELELSGDGGQAEIVIHGVNRDGGFSGEVLRLTREGLQTVFYERGVEKKELTPSPRKSSDFAPQGSLEIAAKGKVWNLRFRNETAGGATIGPEVLRSNFQFRVQGAGAKLLLKGLRLTLE